MEDDNHIFLAGSYHQNYRGSLEELKRRFSNDRQKIEAHVNVTQLSEFFMLAADKAPGVPELVDAFGRVLEYYWGRRLAELFPDRHFEFILAEDICDENGVVVTFYQKQV